MRWSLAVLVIASALAGCTDTTGPVDVGTESITITDPSDLEASANSTAGEHIHDYWGGLDRLVLLDQTQRSNWNTVGGNWWALRFLPESGDVVPQGTASVEVTVDWTDDLGLDHYDRVELWVKKATDNQPEVVQEVERGDMIVMEAAYEDADLPHQLLSSWEFELRLYSTSTTTGLFFGSADMVVEVVRGHELQPFPPHPDHWGDATEAPLVEVDSSYFNFRYTGTGEFPAPIAPGEGLLVPPGSGTVHLTLESSSLVPVGGLKLGYHGADTRGWTWFDPIPSGSSETYTIIVEPGMADGPYAAESLWRFRVESPDVGSSQPAMHQGGFSLTGTVLKS